MSNSYHLLLFYQGGYPANNPTVAVPTNASPASLPKLVAVAMCSAGRSSSFALRRLSWANGVGWRWWRVFIYIVFKGDSRGFHGDLMRFHEGLMGFMGYGDSHQYSVHWVLKWWEMGIAWWFRSGLSDFYLGLWCQTELSSSTSSSRNTSITKVNNKRIFLPLSKYNSI